MGTSKKPKSIWFLLFVVTGILSFLPPDCASAVQSSSHSISIVGPVRLQHARSYYMLRPEGEISGILLMLHGRGARPDMHSRMIDLELENTGMVAVFPAAEGDPTWWNLEQCCRGLPVRVDEGDFLRAVVQDVRSQEGLGGAQVLLSAGFSNGAMLLAKLVCDGQDWLGSVVMVSGALFPDSCKLPENAELWSYQGNSDEIVKFNQVTKTIGDFCQSQSCTKDSKYALSASVQCTKYRIKEKGAFSDCTVEGGGHSWPGGPDIPHLGATVHDFSLSSWILKVAEQRQP